MALYKCWYITVLSLFMCSVSNTTGHSEDKNRDI